MKLLRKKDVPAGAALTIAALVLLVGVVKGREPPGARDPVVEPVAAPPRIAATEGRPASADEIDLDRLKRVRREGAVQDLFPSRLPAAPPPLVIAAAAPAKPVVAPAPIAPPLPFKYLGRLVDGENPIVFLEKNQEALSATVGDVIDNTYKVERVAESAIEFVYLPLGSSQVLNIPAQQ